MLLSHVGLVGWASAHRVKGFLNSGKNLLMGDAPILRNPTKLLMAKGFDSVNRSDGLKPILRLMVKGFDSIN